MVFRYTFMSRIKRLNAQIDRSMEKKKEGWTDGQKDGKASRQTQGEQKETLIQYKY